jgi:cytochrome bd-type quinol oxidase subunit 2
MLGDIENGTRRNNTLDIIYLAHIIVMFVVPYLYFIYIFFTSVATHEYISSLE